MNNKTYKPILETKYLSTENAWRYRCIMRTFFIFDQRYKHWLYKEDIYDEMKKIDMFDDYAMDQCKQDLDALVQWGNLSAVQDTNKVATYQQFVNKQFRYQMTEYAIEIERMTVRLENIFIEGGSLEPTLLERIKDELKELKTMCHQDEKTAGTWWSLLSADFQRLNQNYQDYIRDWYSLKAEELMKTKSFLLYKEKFIEYLRNFIKELQQYAQEIEHILKQVTEKEGKSIIEKVSHYEHEIPRLDMEEVQYEEIFENIRDKYQSIKNFFLGDSGRESEVEKILSMTNEIIRRITRHAANILEMSNQFSSRKEEYKKVADMFLQCRDIEQAHLLSSQVFGISGYKHFQGNVQRETESINSSIFDEKSCLIITKPKIRHYRERIVKTAIKDHWAEKQKAREKILAQRQQEKSVMDTYIQKRTVDFAHIEDLQPFVRETLLRWLAKAMQESNYCSITEYGQKYRIVNPKETKRCVLKCDDGDLDMPAYQIEFEVDRV